MKNYSKKFSLKNMLQMQEIFNLLLKVLSKILEANIKYYLLIIQTN